ncbi:hypothetical protein AAC387_Pa08g2006 [Persea americana]
MQVSKFSGRRFPNPDPRRTVFEPKFRKSVPFRSKLPNRESYLRAVSSYSYSHLERSDNTGFGIFRSPVPVQDPRWAVFEPKCRKSIPFCSKLPNRESYLRAVSSYRLLSSRAKWPCRFQNFPVAGSRSGPPVGRFRA